MMKGLRLLAKSLPSSDEYRIVNFMSITALLRTQLYYQNNPSEVANDAKLKEYLSELESSFNLLLMTDDRQRDVKVMLNNQVKNLFQHIHNHSQENGEIDLASLRGGKINHRLVVKDSLIPNAGRGLFVESSKPIPPGTVIGLYPGLFHLSSNFSNSNYAKLLLPDENYMLISRLDRSVIDTRKGNEIKHNNPYARGEMMNHCGEQDPNVMNVRFLLLLLDCFLSSYYRLLMIFLIMMKVFFVFQ
jgi:hypothetical protein